MKSLESKGIDFKSAISWIRGSMLVVLMGHGFQVRIFDLHLWVLSYSNLLKTWRRKGICCVSLSLCICVLTYFTSNSVKCMLRSGEKIIIHDSWVNESTGVECNFFMILSKVLYKRRKDFCRQHLENSHTLRQICVSIFCHVMAGLKILPIEQSLPLALRWPCQL